MYRKLIVDGKKTDFCKQFRSSGIYGWRNIITNKWYVGQSVDVGFRVGNYIWLNRAVSKQLGICESIRKYGINSFECVLLISCGRSKVALDYWERYFIKLLNSVSPNGYNLNKGGMFNRDVSAETREKQRLAKLGKKQSKELIEKRVARFRGAGPRFKMTDEIREKMRKSHLGKKLSTEQKDKLRKRASEYWANLRARNDYNDILNKRCKSNPSTRLVISRSFAWTILIT